MVLTTVACIYVLVVCADREVAAVAIRAGTSVEWQCSISASRCPFIQHQRWRRPLRYYDSTRVRTCTDRVHTRLSSKGRITVDERERSTGDKLDGWTKWRSSRKRIAHTAPCRSSRRTLFVRSFFLRQRSFLK